MPHLIYRLTDIIPGLGMGADRLIQLGGRRYALVRELTLEPEDVQRLQRQGRLVIESLTSLPSDPPAVTPPPPVVRPLRVASGPARREA